MSTDVAAPAGPRALSRTRQARRDHLLETARATFLQHGYGATTMEGIAAAADVSKATLYKYFQDKDELILTLVRERLLMPSPQLREQYRRTIEETIAQIGRRASQPEVKQALLQHLKTGAERRNDAFFRLVFELGFARPQLLRRVRRELHSGPDGFLSLTSEAAAALSPDVDGEALLHLLFVTITGYTLLEDVVFGPERIDAERLAETLATLICNASMK